MTNIYHDKVRNNLEDIIKQSVKSLHEDSDIHIDSDSARAGIKKAFETIADDLVIGHIVTIRGLGKFEPIPSRQDNFGIKKKHKSKKKHNYTTIKYSPSRGLKTRATNYKDKMTK
jgi:nucleoid DNA-binding protein